MPFMLHVGAGRIAGAAAYLNNGLKATDFLGGGETIRAKDYMVMHTPSELFLIGDGARRHVRAVPAPARRMYRAGRDVGGAVAQAARRGAGFVRAHGAGTGVAAAGVGICAAQLRFTPFPTEPLGWMIEQAGAELFLFSSDYPHIEGGRNPLKRFESAMKDIDEDAKDRFYARNFAELMA